MFAWLCEGRSGGPRARAAAFPDAIAIGMGQRSSSLAEGQRWRSVGDWCSPNLLSEFDTIAGDPGVCHLAPPEARVIAVAIAGQDVAAACNVEREITSWWDCERYPLHGWAGRELPTRAAVRKRWNIEDDRLVIGTLAPTWADRIFDAVADCTRHAVRKMWTAEQMVGCDLIVTSAGWASVWEARWSGVPFLAVDLGRRDHPLRANCDTVQRAYAMVAAFDERQVVLDDEHTPTVPDHRAAFREALASAA